MSHRWFIRLGLAAAILCGVVALAFYVLRPMFSKGLELRRHQLAYRILIDDTVDDFPRIAPDGESVVYRYSAQDGLSPMLVTLSYDSRESPRAVREAYQSSCSGPPRELAADDGNESSELSCERDDYRIDVAILPDGSKTSVVVVFVAPL